MSGVTSAETVAEEAAVRRAGIQRRSAAGAMGVLLGWPWRRSRAPGRSGPADECVDGWLSGPRAAGDRPARRAIWLKTCRGWCRAGESGWSNRRTGGTSRSSCAQMAAGDRDRFRRLVGDQRLPPAQLEEDGRTWSALARPPRRPGSTPPISATFATPAAASAALNGAVAGDHEEDPGGTVERRVRRSATPAAPARRPTMTVSPARAEVGLPAQNMNAVERDDGHHAERSATSSPRPAPSAPRRPPPGDEGGEEAQLRDRR